jgi:hypothetical protein
MLQMPLVFRRPLKAGAICSRDLMRSYALAGGRIKTDSFRDLVETIVSGDSVAAIKLLAVSPGLARERATLGATRQAPKHNFFEHIRHNTYEGDTALHMAAAAYQPPVVEKLISMGADVRARNRRGAEPLHYAADGRPGYPLGIQAPRRRLLQS